MNAHDDLRGAAEALAEAVRDVLGSHPRAGSYPDGPCIEKECRADLQTALSGIEAALAAPKEAGDGDYLRVMRNLEREYPMDAKVIAAYIARLHDGIRRLAAPSKEAGPLDELTREQERLGLYAAPQADQQGVVLDTYDAGLLNDFGGGNVQWWQDYIRAELARAHDYYQSQAAALRATKPSDQQGASLEGERHVDVHSTFYQEPLAAHDPAKSNTEQGLYRKFDVRRIDGSDAPGGKHYGCEYFVLDVSHDRHAPHALLAYAKAAQATHPDLARDLMDRYDLDVYERAALAPKASPDDQRQEGVALPPRRQASDYIADTYGPADLAAIWNACRSETSRLNSASPPTEAAADDPCVRHACKRVRMEMQARIDALSQPAAAEVDDAMVERAMRARIPGGSEAWVWLFNCEGGMRPEEKHRDWFRRVVLAAIKGDSHAG